MAYQSLRYTDRLSYTSEGGSLLGAHPLDTLPTIVVDGGARQFLLTSQDSDKTHSTNESNRLADLSASFRMISSSLMMMKLADIEMIKAREISRIESEKRSIEVEANLTQMLVNTQLEIASFLSRTIQKRKRKRVENDDSSISERQSLLLLMLLQCNMFF
ncbi:uncharacterized protein LOC113318912 [Papaver somniferum]|uniref:uncharacterized protein LOC113318912 n=1 Tax=Papaver somniferum TaxID=3469 RepID=UPI000E6FE4AC|nr:uncharacterized protein LOC113318912 [Papaver somniferum]